MPLRLWWWATPSCLLGLLVAGCTAQQQIQLNCDTQEELNELLEFAHNTCDQVHEKFANKYNPVPVTCTHPTCARAVARVSEDCDGLLQVDWFETASTSKTKDDPKRHESTAREPSRRRRARQWVVVATYRRLRTCPTPLVVHDPQPSGA
eukprot:COSAG05_NODE_1009_length_6209_cov_4.160393_4_plen_150_part_00